VQLTPGSRPYPVGRKTYTSKDKGGVSTAEKAGTVKPFNRVGPSDPVGMVKAILLESQCPFCSPLSRHAQDGRENGQGLRLRKISGAVATAEKVSQIFSILLTESTQRSRVAYSNRKDTNRIPKPT
jgi:hypothetical protein